MSAAQPPILHLIAGCNGAGKTTFAREFLPREARCLNFLNADLIAQGISPLDTEAGAIRADRLLLAEVRALVRRKETFALESTLSGRTYLRLLREAKRQGYRIHLHYLWLPTVSLAIARVRERVKKGGHNVPVADIRRRFRRSRVHIMRITRRRLTDGQYGTIAASRQSNSAIRMLARWQTCGVFYIADEGTQKTI